MSMKIVMLGIALKRIELREKIKKNIIERELYKTQEDQKLIFGKNTYNTIE